MIWGAAENGHRAQFDLLAELSADLNVRDASGDPVIRERRASLFIFIPD